MAGAKYILGIDIGTSGTKTVLFNETGASLRSATREYPLYQPRNGWAEQEPSDWWDAVVATIKEVTSGIHTGEIAGVGLSGQMHGLVLLDGEGKPLRRSIIWCDQRTGEQCQSMTSVIGAKRLIEITGNPALTGFTASKILWIKQNEPEIYEKTKKILLPKDYVRYMLTGVFASEVSDASGTQLLDVEKRRYSAEMLQKLDIDPALLPDVYESFEITGKISGECARLTGLAKDTPVAGGAGDQAAGAIGNGIIREGAASCSLGSSGVVFAATKKAVYDPQGRIHTFCHAVPETWHVMGVAQASGLSLKWFRDNFCLDFVQAASLAGTDPYVLMDKAAQLVPIGSRGLLYLPYLMGERTPHLDPDCRGVFFGLSAIHTRADMIRACMEGVAFSQADCMDIIRTLTPPPSFVRVFGGGGRSPLWRRIISDCLNVEARTPSSPEGPALGAAILAAVGTGLYSSVREACEIIIKDVTAITPDKASVKTYGELHAIYSSLYSSLRDDFKALASLTNKSL